MSKKQRRGVARKRRATQVRSALDKHHICYQRRFWSLGSLHELREFWYSKIMIPRDTLHRAIHREVAFVPTPRVSSAASALAQLKMLESYGAIKETDSLEKRLELYIALFDCIEPETADGFRKQLEIVRNFH